MGDFNGSGTVFASNSPVHQQPSAQTGAHSLFKANHSIPNMEQPNPIETPNDPSMSESTSEATAAPNSDPSTPDIETPGPEATAASGASDPSPQEPASQQPSQQETPSSQEPEQAPESDRMAELEQQVAELKDQLLRKAAEMENMRKRLQRERLQIFEQSRAASVESFLPINDDLQRTLDALHHSDADKAYLEGITMVAEKFESTLEKFGVERISETGVPFDVNLHEALMRQPAPDDDTPSDTVIQVLENGYRIGERVLRHAKVIVSE